MTRRKNLLALWPLLCILAIGSLLRILAISFGLPHLYHADEPIVVNHALAYGSLDFNPHFFRIPPLTSYLLFLIYGLYFLVGKAIGLFPTLLAFQKSFYQDPTWFYFIGRAALGVIPGSLTILATYHLVRKHSLRNKAILASFFVAVSFLHVKDSHYIYADMPLVLTLTLSWLPLWRLVNSPFKTKKHILAGFLCGLATAFKYNGVVIAFPYLLILLRNRPANPKMLRHFLLYTFTAFATYAMLNPFCFIDWNFFIQELVAEGAARQQGTPALHHLLFSLVGGIGWPLLIFALLGLFKAYSEIAFKKMLLASFCIIYYCIICKAGQHYERYVLPILPFALILAADFLWDFFWIALRIRNYYAIALGALVSAAPTILSSLLWLNIMINEDTRTQASEWIQKYIPRESTLALDGDFFMPRLSFSKAQLLDKKTSLATENNFSKIKMGKLNFLIAEAEKKAGYNLYFLTDHKHTEPRQFLFSQPVAQYNINELRSLGVAYIVVRGGFEQPPKLAPFYHELEKSAIQIASFSPYRYTSSTPATEIATTGGPFTWDDLIRRTRNGPALKIYKLK